MILLDTNFVSELMRPVPDPKAQIWVRGLGSTTVATSAITIAEVVFGLARLPDGKRRSDLQERFDALILGPPPLPVLGLDEHAGRIAGEFRALRERLGLGSTASDMTIAAIAMANAASLTTRNTSDFVGLPISVVDPWA